MNSREFRDMSPKQVVPILADRGEYIGSESTIYRCLKAAKQLKHRERSQEPRPRPKSHRADGPGQVWSWDITYLKAARRGTFFYLYMIMDVWSRKIVGWAVHGDELAALSSELIARTATEEGIEAGRLVLHSDNGGPMKGATMLATLRDLGIAASFSRPRVSDDNPYSEALFRTVKYRPEYPSRPFGDRAEATAWVAAFVDWYNLEHRHSGIKYVTPQQRHSGADIKLLKARKAVYAAARAKNPTRWSTTTRDWSYSPVVELNPGRATRKKAPEAPKKTVAQ